MIEFNVHDHGFELGFQGRTFLTHNEKTPCISLGKGTAEYRMRFSHFKIRESVREKKALVHFSVKESSPSRVVVAFDDILTMTAEEKNGMLELRFSCANADINRFWLKMQGSAGEGIYGCGEQYTYFNLKGKNVPIFVQEQGVGRGRDLITFLANMKADAGGAWYTTYFNQPTFISSEKYFCHSDETAYAEFDFTGKDYHILHFRHIPENIIVGTAPSLPKLVEQLSALLGRQQPLPHWVYGGAILGMQGGTEVVDAKLKNAISAGAKIAAVWAQDWEGIRMTSFGKRLFWNWQWNKELYPNLDEKIKEYRERGIRFLGYINPYLATDAPLFREAADRGFLVLRADGSTYTEDFGEFFAGMVDFTNPAAHAWYKGVIKQEMLALGLSGWMADFGEALPPDAILFSKENAERYHNLYPAMWAKANFEAVREAKKEKEIFYFMRAGFTGSSRYAASIWAGDQLVNWSFDDGLATVIPAALSLGMCGIGYHHSDIGGYTTVGWIRRSKELFMRWTEQAAFTQTMRTHEGNRPNSNWQFDSDAQTLAHFARFSRIFAALRDYHIHLSNEYQKTGLPPIRPIFLHYDDAKFLQVQYEYLYGRDLLVAPVLRKGRRRWKVTLPNDVWIHLWSGKAYPAGTHTVDAPIGYPPVFYRSGSDFSVVFEKVRDM